MFCRTSAIGGKRNDSFRVLRADNGRSFMGSDDDSLAPNPVITVRMLRAPKQTLKTL